MKSIRLLPQKRTFVDSPIASATDMATGALLAIAPATLAVVAHYLASHQMRALLILLIAFSALCAAVVIAAAITARNNTE